MFTDLLLALFLDFGGWLRGKKREPEPRPDEFYDILDLHYFDRVRTTPRKPRPRVYKKRNGGRPPVEIFNPKTKKWEEVR